MMNPAPSLFLSHGAPDILLSPAAAREYWQQLGRTFPKPRGILVISAHWTTAEPVVSAAANPKTIYDFRGFPESLFQQVYPAPGAPELAEQVVSKLSESGIPCTIDRDRGLDHGAWVPLSVMYPDADIPVTQISVQPNRNSAHHLEVGRSLAGLRAEGITILASGSMTHNLGYVSQYSLNAAPPDWVLEFDDWMTRHLETGNIDALLNYRKLAPYGPKNHPTEEHLFPLFVAIGAGNEPLNAKRLHSSFTYGVLSMAAFQWY